MKIGVWLVPVHFFFAACAKPAPPAPVARPLPAGSVLFTIEVYDVPSGDELVSGSLEVMTAARALNLRDRLDDVNAELRSQPRIATLFDRPAMVSQGGPDAAGFAFRAGASVDGDQLATRFSWFDLAPGERLPTPMPAAAASWATTVDRGAVIALRLPVTNDGTPRLALVRIEAVR